MGDGTVLREGISILIEAVVVSIIVTAAFSIGYYCMIAGNSNVQRSQGNTYELAFNLISSLAKNGGFDNSIVYPNGTPINGWEQNMKMALNNLLPTGCVYNLSVYLLASKGQPYNISYIKLNQLPISNANSVAIMNLPESVEVSYIYTTPNMKILLFQLQLSKVTSP